MLVVVVEGSIQERGIPEREGPYHVTYPMVRLMLAPLRELTHTCEIITFP